MGLQAVVDPKLPELPSSDQQILQQIEGWFIGVDSNMSVHLQYRDSGWLKKVEMAPPPQVASRISKIVGHVSEGMVCVLGDDWEKVEVVKLLLDKDN